MGFKEKVIQKAQRDFTDALRSMGNDGHMVHVFDFGVSPAGETWSILLVMAPRETLDSLQSTLGEYEPTHIDFEKKD